MGNTDTREAAAPDRPQLANVEAEQQILGAALADPELFVELTDDLGAEDFADARHQALWRCLSTLDSNGQAFEPVVIEETLKQSRELTVAGGRDYIDRVASLAAPSASISSLVGIVTGRALLRRVYTAAYRIGQASLREGADGHDVLNLAEEQVLAVGEKRSGSTIVTMTQAIAEVQAEIERARSMELVGLATGFPKLDEATGGLQGGQMVIIAARPGMGKSVMGLQLAHQVAATTGDMTYYASHEMTHSELTMRLLASKAEVPLTDLKAGRIPKPKEGDVARCAQDIAKLPMLINSRPPKTIGALRSEVRRVSRRGPLAMVVVDYLQLMHGSGRRKDDSRAQEVSEISQGLKEIAMEMEIPVIALSQLNRGVEARADKRPILSDLRESGSLEQDADMVWMLYRDAVYNGNANERDAELLMVKHRGGPLADVNLDFQGPFVRFKTSRRISSANPPPEATFG